MNDLREQVQKVVRDAWPQFQLNHPRLASAIDEVVLTDQISKSLADDPQFQEALLHAEMVGQTTQTIIHWTQRAIDTLLKLRLSPD